MKKSIDDDLTDLSIILESLANKGAAGKLSNEELIDIAARLKPVAKACNTFDEKVKDLVKTKLKHKEGSVPGTLFKAVLKLIPVKRFSQARFKEAKPSLYEQYSDSTEDERITFEIR